MDAGADILQEDNNLMYGALVSRERESVCVNLPYMELTCCRTPYMDVWKYHLVNSPLRHGYDLFDHRPQADHFGFSPLHASVLGLNSTASDPISSFHSFSLSQVNQRDAMGRTALFWAAQRGDAATVGRLLMEGADPRIADNRGSTPLHCGVTESSGQIVVTLLDAGAKIDARDHLGRTAVTEAIRCRESQVEVLQKLFEATPHSKGRNLPGHEMPHVMTQPTPLKRNIASTDGQTQEEVTVNARAIYDRTPLVSTTGGKAHKTLERLLERGADCSLLDNDNRSILHVAADYGNSKCLKILRQAALNSVDRDGKSRSGHTPMATAVWRRDDNVGWSEWAIREPDTDPRHWFNAFQDLYLGIKR